MRANYAVCEWAKELTYWKQWQMARDINGDERTNALGLFNTARSYWRSAEYLNAAHLKLTHPQAPVTFLFCHAIELYLKAYLRGVGNKNVEQLKKMGHRVASLAEAAVSSGLIIGSEQSETLSHIANTDIAMEARYIVTGFKSLPTNEALSNVAEVLDKAVCSALAKTGISVRVEQFTRPELPSPKINDEKDNVHIKILKVDFDPNGPREIYLDFLLSNPGEPTILRNWTLSASGPNGESLDHVVPRVLHTRTTFASSSQSPIVEDLSLSPLEKGGAREGRITYTYDKPAKPIFGKTGTRFWLRTNDVRNRTIEAEYVLSD
jgi:hypothetical protein